jgi:hypothetical protein
LEEKQILTAFVVVGKVHLLGPSLEVQIGVDAESSG